MRRLFAICLACASPAFADADPPRIAAEGPVQVTGPAEVVFDWTTDRCDDRHFADLPVRAFRDADGINLILPHDVTRRMRGPNFDDLRVECEVLLASTIDQNPDQFANYEWVAATYAQRDTVHALIHNEYQGNRYLGAIPTTTSAAGTTRSPTPDQMMAARLSAFHCSRQHIWWHPSPNVTPRTKGSLARSAPRTSSRMKGISTRSSRCRVFRLAISTRV